MICGAGQGNTRETAKHILMCYKCAEMPVEQKEKIKKKLGLSRQHPCAVIIRIPINRQ